MKAWLLSVALISVGPFAQEEERPIARAELEPVTPVMVGEPVKLIVEILVPTWFTGAPRFPGLDIPDTVVIFLETGGFNFSDRINGGTFAGQRREYLIYPMRAGNYAVDEVPISVSYAVNARPSPRVDVSPPSLTFKAMVPAEAVGLDYFLATSSLQLDGSFDRKPEGLKVGDSLTRTITMTATGAFAMMLPPVSFAPMDGVSIYPDQPKVSDSGGERGQQRVGKRVESVTYVFEKEGEYRLPPIEIRWWDTDASRLRRTDLSPVDLHVAPNPDLATEIPLPPEEEEEAEVGGAPTSWFDQARRWAMPVLVLGVLMWLGLGLARSYGPRLKTWLAHRRREREESEAAYFERFKGASLSGDLTKTLNALLSWLDRCGIATVTEFVERAGDDELARLVAVLDTDLFSRTAPKQEGWSGRRLYSKVAQARRKVLTSRHPERADGTATLPELNPR